MSKKITDGERVITVVKRDFLRIMEFQTPVKEWEKLNGLLMTSDNGKPIVGNVFYDWKGLVSRHPQFKKDIKRLGMINAFNTVKEIAGCDESGRMVVISVLFQIEHWREA